MTKYERIYEPGKFEGELAIVPRMWDVVMEGFSHDVDVDGRVYSFVSLLAVDEPVTDGLYGAMLWETDQGFVLAEWFETEAEYKAKIELVEDLAAGEAAEQEEQWPLRQLAARLTGDSVPSMAKQDRVPTYADLAEAAGMLDRAARYLVQDRNGNTPIHMTAADASAAGTLMGLAYMVRPRKVEVGR